MNKYEQGIQIVNKPEEKVSKYEVLARMLRDIEESKSLKVSLEVFGIGSSRKQMKGFIHNLSYFCEKKYNLPVEGMSQNGSIFLWRTKVE